VQITLIIKAIMIAIAVTVGIVAPYFLKKNDTPLEQAAEKIIKDQTGIDIDFSPEEEE